MTLWSYNHDTQEFILNSRIDGGVILRIEGLKFATANQIANAAERISNEGIEAGELRMRRAVMIAIKASAE